jgi:hypothetical protein
MTMAITTLEIACGEQHKETIAAVLAHLRQHCVDLHNGTQMASMRQRTQKETRYLEGQARAFSIVADYIDGIVLK